jgi:hypothetical protein
MVGSGAGRRLLTDMGCAGSGSSTGVRQGLLSPGPVVRDLSSGAGAVGHRQPGVLRQSQEWSESNVKLYLKVGSVAALVGPVRSSGPADGRVGFGSWGRSARLPGRKFQSHPAVPPGRLIELAPSSACHSCQEGYAAQGNRTPWHPRTESSGVVWGGPSPPSLIVASGSPLESRQEVVMAGRGPERRGA